MLTPIKSMRARCVECAGGNKAEVRKCSYTHCYLYPYRMGHRASDPEALRPMKSIRKYCLNCMNGSSNEVSMCHLTDCELYNYRTGHRPKNLSYDAIEAPDDTQTIESLSEVS